jgi:hypothetical protein
MRILTSVLEILSTGTIDYQRVRPVGRRHAIAVPRVLEAGFVGLLPLRLFKRVSMCNPEHYPIFE